MAMAHPHPAIATAASEALTFPDKTKTNLGHATTIAIVEEKATVNSLRLVNGALQTFTAMGIQNFKQGCSGVSNSRLVKATEARDAAAVAVATMGQMGVGA